jgi:integrase
VGDRALWATAMYAGLRRGELMALRWEDVDFDRGVIAVERAWDARARQTIEPKTNAGRRTVQLASVLRAHLREHQLRTGRRVGLIFGRDAVTPFEAEAVRKRAAKAFTDAELDAIGIHECRHTFASLMIAAGVNAKALSTYMGHSSITITLDRYGHLMPGNEDEAAGLLDEYLERSTGAQTGAQSS